MEHTGVLPDIATMVKDSAGGLPLSAVTGHAETMDASTPGGPGGTYTDNPLVAVSVHTMLDIAADKKPYERPAALDARLANVLNTAKAK